MVLRPFSPEDRPLLRRWLADRELRRLAGRRFGFFGLGTDGRDIQFLIVLGQTGRPIGLCGLYGISVEKRTAEVGIVLGERDSRGQGYGPEALRLLLRFAQEELPLHQLCLCVHAANSRAIRAYEKVGFVVERRVAVGRWLLGRGVEILVMTCPVHAGVGVAPRGEHR